MEQRDLAFETAQADGLRLVRVAALSHEKFIEGTRQLLTALSQLPKIKNGEEEKCSLLLSQLLKQYPLYANLGVAKLNGDVICSGLPLAGATNIADRAYFQRAAANLNFAAGDYQIGRITGKPSINFGYPVLDKEGELARVVFAAIDLSWFSQFATEFQLPERATFTIIDRNGTVLVRYPEGKEWVGKAFPEAPLVKAVVSGGGEGQIETKGLDGLVRLYSFTELRVESGAVAFASIGFPKDVVLADAGKALKRNLIWLGIITIFAFLISALSARFLVLQQIKFKDDFLFQTVHDLRTPSTVIKMVLSKYEEPEFLRRYPELRQDVEFVREANERMIRLIQYLFEIAKGERAGLTPKKERVNLQDVIKSTLKELDKIFAEKNITAEYAPAQAVLVLGDKDRLKEVFVNLIENAAKYNKQGGRIIITHETDERFVKTAVADTGIGISSENLPKIFTPYFRAGMDNKIQGTGLGLYIVKTLVEKMGGAVQVVSKPGEGTKFITSLPMA
jgi:signal transduction histidine kinase